MYHNSVRQDTVKSESIESITKLNEDKKKSKADSSFQRKELKWVLKKSNSIAFEVDVDIPQIEYNEHDDDKINESSISLTCRFT